MTLSDLSTVFGMIVVTASGVSAGGKFYLDSEYVSRHEDPPYDNVYVTVASQNLKILFDTQDELDQLESKMDNGIATVEDIARIATLKERLRNLQDE